MPQISGDTDAKFGPKTKKQDERDKKATKGGGKSRGTVGRMKVCSYAAVETELI
jgi:hypothetical protein